MSEEVQCQEEAQGEALPVSPQNRHTSLCSHEPLLGEVSSDPTKGRGRVTAAPKTVLVGKSQTK